MEAAEDTTLEAAIGWLADTILANLPAGGKLDSWICEAGLGNDVEKLKSEVEVMEMAVSAVQGRAARNKPLAKSLALVKELLYDADDVVDELGCYRLQQELQPETLLETDGHGTQQVERSSENADDVQSSGPSRLRSKEWIHFDITVFEENGGPARARCKYCKTEVMCTTNKGTSVLRNHLKSKGCAKKRGASDPSSSTADATTIPMPVVTGSRKRMRTSQESTHITAANPNGWWNKDAFSERIQDITSQLQVKQVAITTLLNILPSDSVGASSSHCQTTISDPRRRTSGLFQGKVYGRAQERGSIRTLIKEHKSTAGVTVMPIVGIGGVGKTALAQLVYNDSAVESHFDHKIWIWVSKELDEMRLTREMLDFVSQETYDGRCSLTKLQEVLKGHIKSKRVLVILDDVWEDIDDWRWNKLLAPFMFDGANGNMIILTTRKLSVAKKRGTTEPINLDGLESDDFFLMFKACAFGDENYEGQVSLCEFARQMTRRLQGNPLAAETAGTLLREHLTMDHWSNILKTGDWKSLQHTGGIMYALKLSYDELPYHLQQCFSYCSIFPYNYQFLAEELVSLWISQGFVKHDYSSKSLEEIGRQYLSGLVNLGLFEQVESKILYFGSPTQTYYAMSGLMHDFARLVSRTECATLDGFQYTDVFRTVHHLSIVTNSVYRRDDQTGNIPRNEKFEFFLQNIVTSVRKLRTLVLLGEYDSFFFKAFQDVFGKAHNLRLLQMSATSADFNSFLCSLVNPTRLRYLKLHDVHTEQRPLLSLVNPTCLWDPKLHDVHTKQKALPHVLSKFFRLQVLDVASFMSLHTVHLEDCREWRIVPSLEILQLLKRLKLSNMLRVREVSVPSLEELVLYGMPDLQRCSCTSVKDMKFTLRVLEIQSCPALEVFDLFQRGDNFEIEHKPWLPSLKRLIMCDCPHLQVQIPLPPSATFFELLIKRVPSIMTMDGSSMGTFGISGESFVHFSGTMSLDHTILAFHNLKHIKYLAISSCTYLTFISFRGLSQLISLQSLRIVSCEKLLSSDDVREHTHEDMITETGAALPSIESLCISDCGITGKWLSLILQHSPTLKELELYDCPQLKLLTTEEKGKIQPDLLPASEASSSGYLDDALRSSVRASSGYVADARPISVVDGVMHIPLNLRKITIARSPHIIFDGTKERFAGFTSLEEEVEEDDQENIYLPQSLEHLAWFDYPRKALRPCFVGNLTCLRKLQVNSESLEYLQLDSCTALEDLKMESCDELVALKGMQSLGTLRSLVLNENSMLESLQLHSCTSLEHLEIFDCSSLVTLEGMESLVNLKHLEILSSPVALEVEGLQSLVNLPALDSVTALESIGPTEGISSHSQELFPALESLKIDDLYPLNTSFCKGLTCLRSLELYNLDAARLTDEQEEALLLLKSLQELCFDDCYENLVDLPAGLHDLPSLKTLKIICCDSISGLPKKGLPPSLEELVISGCSDELSEGCRSLATSKLEVKINGRYVD